MLNPEDYTPQDRETTQNALNELTKLCHKYAKDNGFWDEDIEEADHEFPMRIALMHMGVSEVFEKYRKGEVDPKKGLIDVLTNVNTIALSSFSDPEIAETCTKEMMHFGERIALMHSELSEAFEGFVDGDPPSNKIEGYSQVEEELADTFIRMFDECGRRGYDIGGAVLAKMERNAHRPYRHGKKL